MIYIAPQYQNFFAAYKNIDDFLAIDIDIARDFKNRKTGRFEIAGQGFYIKKHFPAGFKAVLDEILHCRKPHIGAGYEKTALEKLHSLNIKTMEFVAFGYTGKFWPSQKSFLVTKELQAVESLEDTCRHWPTQKPDPHFKRKLIDAIAHIARTSHQNGINHRDFYICHFLLDTSSGPQAYIRNPQLYLIDLHRAQIRDAIPFRWLVKDIGGLYFSSLDLPLTKSDYCRFIKKYTQKKLRICFTQDKTFWQAVSQRAVKTYKRDFGRQPAMIMQEGPNV